MSISVNKRNGQIDTIYISGEEAKSVALILSFLNKAYYETLKSHLDQNNTMREVVSIIGKEI